MPTDNKAPAPRRHRTMKNVPDKLWHRMGIAAATAGVPKNEWVFDAIERKLKGGK